MRAPLSLLISLLAGVAAAAEPAAPRFARKPSATKAGGAVRIEFAVTHPTDVAVFIEDGEGRIVRHLVAGVLGKNPPVPLEPNSLSQSIVWDGKTDAGTPASRRAATSQKAAAP